METSGAAFTINDAFAFQRSILPPQWLPPSSPSIQLQNQLFLSSVMQQRLQQPLPLQYDLPPIQPQQQYATMSRSSLLPRAQVLPLPPFSTVNTPPLNHGILQAPPQHNSLLFPSAPILGTMPLLDQVSQGISGPNPSDNQLPTASGLGYPLSVQDDLEQEPPLQATLDSTTLMAEQLSRTHPAAESSDSALMRSRIMLSECGSMSSDSSSSTETAGTINERESAQNADQHQDDT